ncbi:MAG: transketolase family protein [Actinomycetes bacterium]
MRERFAAATTDLLDEDPSVALVLADISADLFRSASRRHTDRVVNVGIREQLMVSAGAGLALAGMRPVVHSYGPFLLERAFEQVKLDFVHQDVGGVLVSTGASYDWPAGGRTHQAPGDVALLDTLGDWTAHVPGHPDELEPLLRRAVTGDGRAYVRLSTRENRRAHPGSPGEMTMLRRGSGATVVAVGPLLDATLAATEGLDVTVLYATTVRPFDAVGLVATLGTPDVVLVEPYLARTSVPAVTEALRHIPHRVLGLGVGRHEVCRYGEPEEHDRVHGLDAGGLRRALLGFLGSAAGDEYRVVRTA